MSIVERAKGARRFQRRARQEADKEALKALILETARKEFAAGTLETVSIQKIADAIGYSKGTVLKYYPTKLLLLLAVKQQNLEAVAERLERVRAETADSDLRLRRVMETYLDYWADNPDHFRSLFSMSGTIEDPPFSRWRLFRRDRDRAPQLRLVRGLGAGVSGGTWRRAGARPAAAARDRAAGGNPRSGRADARHPDHETARHARHRPPAHRKPDRCLDGEACRRAEKRRLAAGHDRHLRLTEGCPKVDARLLARATRPCIRDAPFIREAMWNPAPSPAKRRPWIRRSAIERWAFSAWW
ncbi:TetR/AcrR family transcriptional regulator [Bradyrhizobium elkanii]